VSVTEAAPIIPLLDRNHFLLRRLHSLTGIVPVGAFLMEHLLTNSGSWYGPARYNKDVSWIQDMPFLFILEWGFIFLPLAFHAGYGFYIAWTGRMNASTYPYMNNRRYTLQRVTAYATLVFIVIHLLKFRFAYLIGGPVFAQAPDWFALTKQGLLHWHVGTFYMPAWFTLSFYTVGLTAAVYHFANGIWTFAISWGILGGPDSQRWFQYVCLVIGLVMCGWGYLSLWGFLVNG
jgi:succinate dehydrogenase / fumarate reductase, cytochrome b subunit